MLWPDTQYKQKKTFIKEVGVYGVLAARKR